jgi:hypothetical protein
MPMRICARVTSRLQGDHRTLPKFAVVRSAVWTVVDDAVARLGANAGAVFGGTTVDEVFERWLGAQLDSHSLRSLATSLREAAFTEAGHPGTVPLEGLVDPPGVLVTLAAVFDHLALACGGDGVVIFEREDAGQA